jgi:hypothetical protein
VGTDRLWARTAQPSRPGAGHPARRYALRPGGQVARRGRGMPRETLGLSTRIQPPEKP